MTKSSLVDACLELYTALVRLCLPITYIDEGRILTCLQIGRRPVLGLILLYSRLTRVTHWWAFYSVQVTRASLSPF